MNMGTHLPATRTKLQGLFKGCSQPWLRVGEGADKDAGELPVFVSTHHLIEMPSTISRFLTPDYLYMPVEKATLLRPPRH